MKSKTLAAAVAAVSLLASSAYAIDSTPLPAGKPAGTKDAALLAASPFLLIGIVAVAVVIGVAASSSSNNKVTTGTTTGTSS
jgi:hypothetical protein